jgi:hypothetical protein
MNISILRRILMAGDLIYFDKELFEIAYALFVNDSSVTRESTIKEAGGITAKIPFLTFTYSEDCTSKMQISDINLFTKSLQILFDKIDEFSLGDGNNRECKNNWSWVYGNFKKTFFPDGCQKYEIKTDIVRFIPKLSASSYVPPFTDIHNNNSSFNYSSHVTCLFYNLSTVNEIYYKHQVTGNEKQYLSIIGKPVIIITSELEI